MTELACGHEPSHSNDIGVGYGEINGQNYCYPCCGELERIAMVEHGTAFLYWKPVHMLTDEEEVKTNRGHGIIVDWPGNIIAPVMYYSTGKHNIAGIVQYLWFNFNDYGWIGKHYPVAGDYVRCKRLKTKVA